MLTLDEAVELAAAKVREIEAEVGKPLEMSRRQELDCGRGWVFAYQTIAFCETGDPRTGLVGNRPIFVDRHTGAVVTIPTGPIAAWVDEYDRTGVALKLGWNVPRP